MSSRDQIFARIRDAVGRVEGDACPAPPAVRIAPAPEMDRVRRFSDALTALGGVVIEVPDAQEAQRRVASMIDGKTFVTSTNPFSLEACAAADIGITSAEYALADTGSLVYLSESGEARLLSLLPPRHIAIIERDRILSSLDELFSLVPHPAANSSAMVIITGPSRTADIEMRLVRGVHGPGEVTVVVVG